MATLVVCNKVIMATLVVCNKVILQWQDKMQSCVSSPLILEVWKGFQGTRNSSYPQSAITFTDSYQSQIVSINVDCSHFWDGRCTYADINKSIFNRLEMTCCFVDASFCSLAWVIFSSCISLWNEPTRSSIISHSTAIEQSKLDGSDCNNEKISSNNRRLYYVF